MTHMVAMMMFWVVMMLMFVMMLWVMMLVMVFMMMLWVIMMMAIMMVRLWLFLMLVKWKRSTSLYSNGCPIRINLRTGKACNGNSEGNPKK